MEETTTKTPKGATMAEPAWLVAVRKRAKRYGKSYANPTNAGRAASDRSDLVALIDCASKVEPRVGVVLRMAARALENSWADQELTGCGDG